LSVKQEKLDDHFFVAGLGDVFSLFVEKCKEENLSTWPLLVLDNPSGYPVNTADLADNRKYSFHATKYYIFFKPMDQDLIVIS
jgi:hypothetical protein